MTGVNLWAIPVAAVAGFVVSMAWYTVFGTQLQRLRGAPEDPAMPPPWKFLVEAGRSLVVAAVTAGLVAGLDISIGGAVLLALALWVGFPVVLWTGAILWENVPWRLAVLHAGDWLAKLVVIAAIIGAWR